MAQGTFNLSGCLCNQVETNSMRVLPAGFKALTTSVTGFLDQCAAEGKVRNP